MVRFPTIFYAFLAIAQGAEDVEMSKISGDPAEPRRHFRLVSPAKLSPQQAGEIYAIVRRAMQGDTRARAAPPRPAIRVGDA